MIIIFCIFINKIHIELLKAFAIRNMVELLCLLTLTLCAVTSVNESTNDDGLVSGLLIVPLVTHGPM